MKLSVYISGALFSALILLAMLFKMMHWPGGNAGLVFGFAGFALIFIPLFTIYRYKKDN